MKYVKIVGDGDTFYLLTEDGEVYFISGNDNGTWQYLLNKFNIDICLKDFGLCGKYQNMIYKLNTRDIVNIFDSCTAITKDGKMISLIEEKTEGTSIVEELQKQTDKYLVASHLGLKDGILYDFSNVRQGIEVTKGKLIKVNSEGYGEEFEDDKIKLFSDPYIAQTSSSSEQIGVEPLNETLPKFVDIAENRNSYLGMLAYRYLGDEIDELYHTREKFILDYSNKDKYALCYAVSEDGEIWAYIGGYIIDTGRNLDFFGPTTNYVVDNTNWTNQDINLHFTENTTNTINVRNVKKGEDVISNDESVTIDKNGDYSIEITDSKGRSDTTLLKVLNIDKLEPRVSLELHEGENKVFASAVDENETQDYAKSGIKDIKYQYEGDTEWHTATTYVDEDGNTIGTIDLEYSRELTVIATDNAGNTKTIHETFTTSHEELPKKGTLNVDPNGGKYDSNSDVSIYVQNEGTTKSIEEPEAPNGYTVSFDTKGGNEILPIQTEKEFEKWEINENPGGSFINNEYTYVGEVEDTITAYYINKEITLPEPTRKGYTFKGWYSDENCEEKVGDAESKYTATSDVTLYAKWEVNQYTVTFYDEDGKTKLGECTVDYGKDASYTGETPTKEADVKYIYTFDNWYTSTLEDAVVDDLKNVTANRDVYAKYSKVANEYAVIVKYVDLNGTKLKEDIILKGKFDEKYKTERLEFEKYVLNEVEGNEEGKFTKETQIVIYKYKKLAGRVIAKYIDSEGNTIHEDTITTGQIDEEYKVDRIQIEGYELKNVIGKEEGIYKLEDQTVIFKYKKIENTVLPQTGQARMAYIILGAIVIISITTLGYYKLAGKK